MMGWVIAGGVLLGMIITAIAVWRWRKNLSSDMCAVGYHVQESDPKWKKYKIEDPVSGGLIPVDYDPDKDGEFTGDLGMIPALAAIQLGGVVMMNQVEPDKWEITGPGGVKGEGRTPSEAYGQILKRVKQDVH